jgi:hypothetical protein
MSTFPFLKNIQKMGETFMKTKLLILFLLALFISTIQLHSTATPAQAAELTAYKVEVAFYTELINPHYGAFFSGSNGRNQFYTGSSGQPSGYSSWNWWGSGSNVLLPEKSWLFLHLDGWTPSNHHAQLDCPC